MAGFNEVRSDALEELIANINNLPCALRDEIHKRGLDAAGDILVEYQRGSLQEEGLIDTGRLMDSVSAHKHEGYVEVYPSGKRADGESNAMIGFVLEYGRDANSSGKKAISATHWMSKAAEAAADDIEAAVLEIYDDVLNRLF